MAKTRVGRIVYNHPPHLFSYADVNRVVRVVRPAELRDAPFIMATILRAFEDLFTLELDAVEMSQLLKAIPATFGLTLVIRIVLFVIDLIASLEEAAGRLLFQATGSAWLKIAGWLGAIFAPPPAPPAPTQEEGGE